MLAPIFIGFFGGRALADNLHTPASTAGETHSARSFGSKRSVIAGSRYLLALTAALLVACGGGGGGSGGGGNPPPPAPVTRPGAPTAMTATAGNNQVTITWGAVAGATSYNIYRSTTAGQQGASVGTSTGTSFVDTTAVNGTAYLYQVTAVNAGGEGQPSTQSTSVTPTAPVTLPAIPGGVAATLSAGQVTVTWTAVTGATSYNIYRSTTQGSSGASVGTSAITTFVDSSVVNGTSYYYQVAAVNSAGEGSLSTQAAATAAAATTWRNAKWGGGGYVTGLIFHPTSANVLYARTDIGGAYRWNQARMSWVPITDGFSAAESFFQGAESIALDPNDDRIVYMSTGLYASADATARLYISSDRGDHWTSVNLPFSAGANNNGRAIGERMMVDPNLPSTLYYGSRTAGLWKSSDSGRNWAQVTSLSTLMLTSAQLNALGGTAMGVEGVLYDTSTRGTGTATQTIYVAIAPDYTNAAGLTANLYKSVNAGATWTAVTTPVSGYHIPHMVRADDGMFYVAFTQGSGPGAAGPGRLYKFDGTTWTLLASSNSWGHGSVSVFGTGATTRIALGVSNSWGNFAGQQIVQLSDDAGQTWREIEALNPGSVASGWVDDIEIDPSNRDHILHVHGGGVIETRNASSATPTWAANVEGLEETAVLRLVTPPAGAPYLAINSSGDIGSWVHTDLTTTPTRGPDPSWNNGFAADMAWSDPLYIASIGIANWNNGAPRGYWSGDGGQTWAQFATLPTGAVANSGSEASIAVTARNNAVWAPANAVPSYTTNNGATWVATNLPALPSIGTGIGRGYHLAVDRVNPNKVYAYDSGGHWWGSAGKVYVSTDAGHTFTLSAGATGLTPNHFGTASLAVNPNVEGDVWLTDGSAVYHSTDSGATWTKLSTFASIMGANPWPAVYGATAIALGKSRVGATYSAAVYVVGVVNGVWGVYRSDDGGATWDRFNDDAHQFGGIGVMAADQNQYGRIYISGNGRGVLYSN
jgi:xyloglucan-specific exo-beta-1,4-glucanase